MSAGGRESTCMPRPTTTHTHTHTDTDTDADTDTHTHQAESEHATTNGKREGAAGEDLEERAEGRRQKALGRGVREVSQVSPRRMSSCLGACLDVFAQPHPCFRARRDIY